MGRNILGGTVHRVPQRLRRRCRQFFVDRGFRQARRILVPYLGSAHDRLALSSRSAHGPQHRSPGYRAFTSSRRCAATHRAPSTPRANVERIFDDPTQPRARFTFPRCRGSFPRRRRPASSPAVRSAGRRRRRGMGPGIPSFSAGAPNASPRDCPCSLLIVRKKHGGQTTLNPAAGSRRIQNRVIAMDEKGHTVATTIPSPPGTPGERVRVEGDVVLSAPQPPTMPASLVSPALAR